MVEFKKKKYMKILEIHDKTYTYKKIIGFIIEML
jgi:hypothetical protein